ncbi:hypothetical protein Tco_0031502 [Tanacetum coccineum]
MTANRMEPGTSRGSDTSDAPSSSSLINCRLSKLFCGFELHRTHKHMTGDRSQLTNFIHKFLSTVKLGNDQVLKIMGYGDYQKRNITNQRYDVDAIGLEYTLGCNTSSLDDERLTLNPPPSAPFVPPSRHEWDLVFQPVFDEFFYSPASVASLVPVEEAPAPIESIGSPSLTTVDQDAPSPITSQTTPQSQS